MARVVTATMCRPHLARRLAADKFREFLMLGFLTKKEVAKNRARLAVSEKCEFYECGVIYDTDDSRLLYDSGPYSAACAVDGGYAGETRERYYATNTGKRFFMTTSWDDGSVIPKVVNEEDVVWVLQHLSGMPLRSAIALVCRR